MQTGSGQVVLKNQEEDINVNKISQSDNDLKINAANEETAPTSTEQMPIKIDLKTKFEGVSSLSLSSIKLKKEEAIKDDQKKKEQKKLRNPISEDQLIAAWKRYTQNKRDQGASNIVSILEICQPKLQDEALKLSVPNNINKVELQREGEELLPFLRAAVQNDHLYFDIDVNHQKKEEFVYTSEEKYNKLLSINPSLKKLRDTFGLEY